ncbi:MKRN2 opposite strand protein isoform X2 [Plodia interpunctella]|uniref:MKRN2 opposite strand protein isoform X2 n=1 Tax=Plodia interpunctella TaxID=58824 RepID=UPI002367C828|nr:MKRN2 opposite strand protein isoform X2 [Plodia interpunctella]
MDPGILCFHHCEHKVFCTIIPEECPVCHHKLDRYDYNLLPFSDYYNSKDLHIGVTNSLGRVVEFCEEGIRGVDTNTKKWSSRDTTAEWDQCLLLEQFDELWNEIWDSVLLKVSLSPLWEADRYNEDRHNCFTFVLAFLRALDCGELSEKAQDPKLFCKQYVVPRTSAAGKYISLYRQLKRQSYFIQNQ